MSQGDSFLDEVSEEVRRDRLVATLRRNAVWIALAVVVVVGAAAAWEWRKAAQRAAAEERGAALWAAIESADEAGAGEGIADLDLPGADGAAFLALQRAALGAEDIEASGALEALRTVAADGTVSGPLRDAARLKLVALGHAALPAQERIDILEQLLVEGHPMRALALEQRALVHLGEGDRAAAVADLRAVAAEGALGSSRAAGRALELLTALGASPAGGDENG